MSTTQAVTREPAGNSEARNPSAGPRFAGDREVAQDDARNARGNRRTAPVRPSRVATDDEILGLDSDTAARDSDVVIPRSNATRNPSDEREIPRSARDDNREVFANGNATLDKVGEPEHLRAALDANPELRQAWQEANSYRASFSTPEEAHAATALLADLDRMDALFFSQRPEDHAELARALASLDPEAFASLTNAMANFATEAQRHGADSNSIVIPRPGEAGRAEEPARRQRMQEQVPRSQTTVARDDNGVGSVEEKRTADSSTADRPLQTQERRESRPSARNDSTPAMVQPSAAQLEFFHTANAAAVRNVLDAIETQVERLLPESVSKNARNRVVGEIYRELDGALRSNRQLGQQMRDAFRAGALDGEHQRAVLSLLTSRARQALPGVAKRVLSEWTSTVLAANQDRRARQRAAESRVDIAGSGGAGNDGRRSLAPRDIDYARLSDSDILNM